MQPANAFEHYVGPTNVAQLTGHQRCHHLVKIGSKALTLGGGKGANSKVHIVQLCGSAIYRKLFVSGLRNA